MKETITPQAQLIEDYKKGKEIPVLIASFNSYSRNERNTLDHIVMINKQERVVRMKPQIPNYQNYKIEYEFDNSPYRTTMDYLINGKSV